ncbi:MAG: beta-galactosidase [candidate division Zixibacteria bacterium]|nr:beta-galactosidase [candidate division Zixibacteria bacterium]
MKNKIVIGKEEYVLNAAEIHYFTVNKRYWSICFERIKKAGFKIISTAVPWNLHEISMGDFDFAGETDSRRDLVVFLELAREFGFKVILKIGPYVGDEWENGGYPVFVTDNEELAARDSQGRPVTISEQKEFPEIVLPSFNHPVFKNHCKRYISALSKVLKNYIYPKGPIIIIKLGRKSSYNFFNPPFHLDYNTYNIKNLYPSFLKNEYKEIKALKSDYHSNSKNFEEVYPPTDGKIKRPSDLIKYLDWIKFKTGLVSSYILNLKDLFLSSQVLPLFSTDIFWKDGSLSSSEWVSLQKENILAGIESSWFKSYTEYSWHLRSFVSSASFPWAIEFMIGAPAQNPELKKKYLPIKIEETKFMLIVSLAMGIKGFNHAMFVETGHWYGTPLAEDGTIQEGYEFLKSFNLLLDRIGLSNLESIVQISLMNYNPYLYLSQLEYQNLFPYLSHLIKQAHFRLSDDLRGLKFDYKISDLENEKTFEKYKILLVPCAEFMDLKTQSLLLEQARKGKSLILYGLLPKYDLRFKNCWILTKALKLKTVSQYAVDMVQTSKSEFSSQLYGYIKTHPKSYQVIARSGKRIVGLKGNLGKGKIYLFTFDISTTFNHRKLGLLEQILEDAGVTRILNCSDNEVEVIVQKNEKTTLLYLISPGVPLTPGNGGNKKSIILQVDCKKIGVKGKKITLTDLFSGELIRTTSKELNNGIPLEMGKLDARMYLVEGAKG